MDVSSGYSFSGAVTLAALGSTWGTRSEPPTSLYLPGTGKCSVLPVGGGAFTLTENARVLKAGTAVAGADFWTRTETLFHSSASVNVLTFEGSGSLATPLTMTDIAPAVAAKPGARTSNVASTLVA